MSPAAPAAMASFASIRSVRTSHDEIHPAAGVAADVVGAGSTARPQPHPDASRRFSDDPFENFQRQLITANKIDYRQCSTNICGDGREGT
jgi:hypothetical protein